jgi:hypothetical protein
VKNWLAMDAKWLTSLQDREVKPDVIIRDAKEHQKTIQKQFAKLFDNFFSLIH